MVSLESPTRPTTPQTGLLSAFLAAYVECKNNIAATARHLQIPLETALDLLAEPALQARLAALDESERRAARQAATDSVHQAMAALTRISQMQGMTEYSLKAASHLYRASIWLVRIAEGKVTPDRLPDRLRPRSASPPPSSDADDAARAADRLFRAAQASPIVPRAFTHVPAPRMPAPSSPRQPAAPPSNPSAARNLVAAATATPPAPLDARASNPAPRPP
jgi:hypothetical protein